MARAIVTALILLSTTVQSALAADDDAPVVPEPVQVVADKTGKDPVELFGAVVATGLDPDTYLCRVGEGPCPAAPPPPPSPVVAAPPAGSVWDRLAQCEAGGNWGNTANRTYSGGLQMDAQFWSRYGGLAYAATPARATRAQQIAVAQRGQAVQGWGAWPVCSRVVGLR